jgi:hypothetical protein
MQKYSKIFVQENTQTQIFNCQLKLYLFYSFVNQMIVFTPLDLLSFLKYSGVKKFFSIGFLISVFDCLIWGKSIFELKTRYPFLNQKYIGKATRAVSQVIDAGSGNDISR